MSKKYDVVAIVGKYQKDGQEKNVYRNVGEIFNSGDRFFLKMNQIPFDDDGKTVNFFSLYEPKAKESQAPQAKQAIQGQQAAAQEQEFDDDIPF